MERTPSIRTARKKDLGAIVGLLADDDLGRQREAADATLVSPYLRAFDQIDRDPSNELVVVEEEGRVVATLQLTFVPSLTHRGGERAQVEGVRVASNHCGSGTGRLLLGWVVERARLQDGAAHHRQAASRRPALLRGARVRGDPRWDEAAVVDGDRRSPGRTGASGFESGACP